MILRGKLSIMFLKMNEVRRPLNSENGRVAELILQSDCGLLRAFFGEKAAALLHHLQTLRSNPYSAENALVMVEEPMAVIGALIGSIATTKRGRDDIADGEADVGGLLEIGRNRTLVRQEIGDYHSKYGQFAEGV